MIEKISLSYVRFQDEYVTRREELDQAGTEAFEALQKDLPSIQRLSFFVADSLVSRLFSGDRKRDPLTQKEICQELYIRTLDKIWGDFVFLIESMYEGDPVSTPRAQNLFRYTLSDPRGHDEFVSEIGKSSPHLFKRAINLPSRLELRILLQEKSLIANVYNPENGFDGGLRTTWDIPRFSASLERYEKAERRLRQAEALLIDLEETASKIDALIQSKYFLCSFSGVLARVLLEESAR